MATPSTSHEVRFSEFAFDLRTGELRRNGELLKLQPQPAKVLSILVSRAGEVVTRQDLVEQVWGADTYVDFEHGLNYAIRHIRGVLEDDPDRPIFLETVPKRGYRFIASIENAAGAEQVPPHLPLGETPSSRVVSGKIRYVVTAAVLAVILGLTWYVRSSWVRRAGASQIRSLAVLPLRNLSNDPNQEYFTDGITDELITDLAKTNGLRVISHTSVERYKGTKLSLPEIARELGGVDAVVEGTVMRSGDRVRITAQLIDSHSDQHLWANSYERTLSDVLRTESDVSQSIAETIRLKLSPEVKEDLAAAAPVSPEAHDAYLKGRFFWNQRTEPDLKKALDSFQQAIAKDPNYAPAYAGIADTYFYLGFIFGHMRPTDAMPLARVAAQRAIELNPNSAEGHASLATVELTYDWNFPAAERELKRAIALNPNNEWVRQLYGTLLIVTGRPDEAILEGRKAVQIDPVSVNSRNILGYLLVIAGRIDESIAEDLETLEMDPNPENLGMIHARLQDSYRSKGLKQEAFEEHIKTISAYGADAKEIERNRRIYAEKGWRGLDEDYLKRLLGEWEKDPWHFTAFQIAGLYARLGDKDQAFDWLNRCIELRSTMMYLIGLDNGPASLRSDPRFAEIKRKMEIGS